MRLSVTHRGGHYRVRISWFSVIYTVIARLMQ